MDSYFVFSAQWEISTSALLPNLNLPLFQLSLLLFISLFVLPHYNKSVQQKRKGFATHGEL